MRKVRRLAVDPIRDTSAIDAIKQLTKPHPRNHLLFVAGINSGLRAADLVQLLVGQVRGLGVGDVVQIKETKRGKENVFVINGPIHEALTWYFESYPGIDDHWPIFFSQNRPGKAISTQRVGDLVVEWALIVGLKGRYGAHSLRKTWGYQSRQTHKVPWEIICDRYGHDSPATTRTYLGLKKAETTRALMNGI